MRVVALGLIGVLSAGTAAWACPDVGLSAEAVGYDGTALAQVQTRALTAGGAHALQGCDMAALGFGRFGAAPDHSFVVSDQTTDDVVLAVTSDCDASLLVHGADGRWRFNDDGNGNLDPRLTLAAGAALNGTVDVWVGSLNDDGCPATLQIAQAAVAAPITPFSRGPISAVPLGAVDPSALQPVQAQAPMPAPLPMPAPMPAPIPVPVPVPIPAPVPAPVPAAICPNPNLVGPSLTVTGPQLVAPQAYVAQIGGNHSIDGCPGITGYGMAYEAPSFTLYMSQMDGYQFTAETTSDCDPTMIMRDAYGQWHFNDDGPNGVQPQIVLNGAQLNGRVDIWVGSFSGAACQGTVVFRSAVGMAPSAPAMGMQGCPNPGLQGVPVTTTGANLFTPTDFYVAAGGTQDVSQCGLPTFASGFFAAQPNLTFFLSGMQDYARLEIQGQSACDTVLLVRTPDGSWYFDDDSNGNMDPMLDLYNTGMLNGRLDIWMGTYDGNGNCQATVEMETWAN